MANIQNDQQFIDSMENLIKEILEEATDEVLKLFKKEYIRRYVYAPLGHSNNSIYYDDSGEPTYQFEEAWEWTDVVKRTNALMTELWYNYEDMDFDMDTFLHGSQYNERSGYSVDQRANLMDILNKKGYSSSLWLSISREEAYWDVFIRDLFDHGELEKILSKHFLAKGFVKS